MPIPSEDCPIGIEVRTEMRALRQKDEDLHETDEQQWTAINKLRELLDRPPAWCAWAMTAMGSVAGMAIGALVTVLVT